MYLVALEEKLGIVVAVTLKLYPTDQTKFVAPKLEQIKNG